MVYLNTDISGDAVNAKLMYCQINAAAAQPFYQLEFGEGAVHTATNIVQGARGSCFQVIGNGSREKIPIRFNSDHIPQNFKLSIYNIGEPTSLTVLGANGAQIWMEYDFIAN